MARLIKLLSLPLCLLLFLIVGVTSSGQNKRDSAYLKHLRDLLYSVESLLEEYGATEPDCQKRATCEIYKKSLDGIELNDNESHVLKFVNKMRKEIQISGIILPSLFFEFYEEAVKIAESQHDCKQFYKECPEIK